MALFNTFDATSYYYLKTDNQKVRISNGRVPHFIIRSGSKLKYIWGQSYKTVVQNVSQTDRRAGVNFINANCQHFYTKCWRFQFPIS